MTLLSNANAKIWNRMAVSVLKQKGWNDRLCKEQKYVFRISKCQTLLMGFERGCSKCGSERVKQCSQRTRQKVPPLLHQLNLNAAMKRTRYNKQGIRTTCSPLVNKEEKSDMNDRFVLWLQLFFLILVVDLLFLFVLFLFLLVCGGGFCLFCFLFFIVVLFCFVFRFLLSVCLFIFRIFECFFLFENVDCALKRYHLAS